MRRAGLPPLTAADGLELFDTAVSLDDAAVALMRVDTDALRPQAAAGTIAPLLRAWYAASPAAPPKPRAPPPARGRDLGPGWPGCPRPNRTGRCWTWSVRRSPPYSDTKAPAPSSPAGPSRNSASTR
ncbi:hypothetical protein SLAVM298S_00015 [Streptomyces lavendulae subsp. lavendulae]